MSSKVTGRVYSRARLLESKHTKHGGQQVGNYPPGLDSTTDKPRLLLGRRTIVVPTVRGDRQFACVKRWMCGLSSAPQVLWLVFWFGSEGSIEIWGSTPSLLTKHDACLVLSCPHQAARDLASCLSGYCCVVSCRAVSCRAHLVRGKHKTFALAPRDNWCGCVTSIR